MSLQRRCSWSQLSLLTLSVQASASNPTLLQVSAHPPLVLPHYCDPAMLILESWSEADGSMVGPGADLVKRFYGF